MAALLNTTGAKLEVGAGAKARSSAAKLGEESAGLETDTFGALLQADVQSQQAQVQTSQAQVSNGRAQPVDAEQALPESAIYSPVSASMQRGTVDTGEAMPMATKLLTQDGRRDIDIPAQVSRVKPNLEVQRPAVSAKTAATPHASDLVDPQALPSAESESPAANTPHIKQAEGATPPLSSALSASTLAPKSASQSQPSLLSPPIENAPSRGVQLVLDAGQPGEVDLAETRAQVDAALPAARNGLQGRSAGHQELAAAIEKPTLLAGQTQALGAGPTSQAQRASTERVVEAVTKSGLAGARANGPVDSSTAVASPMLTAKQVGPVEGRAMNPPSLQELALQASQLTAPSAASAAGQPALSRGHGPGEVSSQKIAMAFMGFASPEVPDAVMPKTIAATELGQQASADPGIVDMSLGPAIEPDLSGISITESSSNGVLSPIGPLSTAPTSSVAMLGLSAPLTGLSAQTTINMQDANWPAQLGQELVQLRQAGEQALKVVLAPEHLGHMELELRQLSDGSLELRMQAENSSARDLLLAQSSDLREKLHNQGMSLSHFSCSSQEQRDGTRRQESGEGQGLAEAASDGADKDTSPAGHIAAVSSAGLHLYA